MVEIEQSSDRKEIPDGAKMLTESTASIHKFVSPGILLFVDQMFVAIGNWIYWLVVSRFVATSDVGHATTIYSLVLLVNTILQLGLEYPLLKKSVEQRRRIFGTVMIVEMAVTAISVPIVFFATSYLYEESAGFTWIALGILVLSSAGFVSRFALLGISQAKTIVILDLIGTVLKFGSAFALISIGYGAVGILLSFLIHAIVLACTTTLAAKRLFGFGIGNKLFKKEIVKDGLVNMPSKLSGMLIISLSIILLASFGVDSSEVGTFYIAMMMSIIAGTFASSLAFMSIPASSELKADLSTGSLRLGLAFTAPIITILLLAPNTILGLIGTEYTSASSILPILGAAVLPSVILSNASSKFNNINDPKKLLVIGAIRVGSFLSAFFVLVPIYGTIGAAYSILISFTSSAAISLVYSGKTTIRYILIALFSITISVGGGQIIMSNVSQSADLVVVLSSAVICLAIIFALKCVSLGEITIMAKSLLIQRRTA